MKVIGGIEAFHRVEVRVLMRIQDRAHEQQGRDEGEVSVQRRMLFAVVTGTCGCESQLSVFICSALARPGP